MFYKYNIVSFEHQGRIYYAVSRKNLFGFEKFLSYDSYKFVKFHELNLDLYALSKENAEFNYYIYSGIIDLKNKLKFENIRKTMKIVT